MSLKKIFPFVIIGAIVCACASPEMEEQLCYDLDINEMTIRDPFILPVTEDSTYYMNVSSYHNSISCYASRDLRKWRYCGESFQPEEDFWGKKEFWAPDTYFYNGRYYIVFSVGAEKPRRGITILVSDHPDSGFRPVVNHALTPSDWTCIDASIYIDNENYPWLLYSREWVEVDDGEIYLQRLSENMDTLIGEPQLLFRGSSAPWTGVITSGGSKRGIVTNAPFMYSDADGNLFILWSGFKKSGKYTIGQAFSDTGLISGPWIQRSHPLNADGGHAMIFQDFNGRKVMSYHTNDLPERIVLRPVEIRTDSISFLN